MAHDAHRSDTGPAIEPRTRFAFGRNWRDFSRHIDEDRIAESMKGLARLLGRDELQNLSLLDIGSGSGVHAAAAARLGAARVLAIDIDADAVATTRATLARFAPGARCEVRQGCVLDLVPEAIGTFDVVYSWGVLHHTGDLWRALATTSRLVAPRGLLALAIYKRTRCCPLWAREKAWFVRSSERSRRVALRLYLGALGTRDFVRLRRPLQRKRAQRQQRGMEWRAVALDWIGGYPYESATPEQVRAFVEPLGFELQASFNTRASLGLLGTGNAEYRFRRIR